MLTAATTPSIAYFCAEYGVHNSLPNYSGGLGILAGDHLKSASDLNTPLVAVGADCRPTLFERQRPTILGASLLGVRGKVQREGEVIHLVSEDTRDLSFWLRRLQDEGSLPQAENTSQTPPHFRGRNFH